MTGDDRVAYDFAVLRVVPHVHLGDFSPIGVILHYRGNAEFELEMTPALGGLALMKAAILGATPLLAPGTMSLLGIIGLLYTWRHPAAD